VKSQIVGEVAGKVIQTPGINQKCSLYYYNFMFAQVAELVDALVSNTSGSNTVPVRSRPWALILIILRNKGFIKNLASQIYPVK
jgi:hypothetical protein